jgi:hypothetical protein
LGRVSGSTCGRRSRHGGSEVMSMLTAAEIGVREQPGECNGAGPTDASARLQAFHTFAASLDAAAAVRLSA